MRIRPAAAAFVMAALLWGAGGPAFCVSATHGVMPCCKSAVPCGAGMKAADCCRFVPASPTQAPAAVETSQASKTSRQETQWTVLAEIAPGAGTPMAVSTQASPPSLLLPEHSVPLYILNTSLLR
jgi:hypothetical protein